MKGSVPTGARPSGKIASGDIAGGGDGVEFDAGV